MDAQTYKKTPGRAMKGRTVVSLSELSNGVVTLPAGTRFRVDRKLDGLHITSEPCEQCGCSAHFERVDRAKVDFVDDAEPAS